MNQQDILALSAAELKMAQAVLGAAEPDARGVEGVHEEPPSEGTVFNKRDRAFMRKHHRVPVDLSGSECCYPLTPASTSDIVASQTTATLHGSQQQVHVCCGSANTVLSRGQQLHVYVADSIRGRARLCAVWHPVRVVRARFARRGARPRKRCVPRPSGGHAHVCRVPGTRAAEFDHRSAVLCVSRASN